MSTAQEVRVLRVTRHEPSGDQYLMLQELARRLLNAPPGTPVAIHTHKDTVRSIPELVQRIKDDGAHIVEAVLPLDMLRDLLEALSEHIPDVIVIQAIMRRELVGDQAVFHFEGYRRVRQVRIEVEDLAVKDKDGSFTFYI